MKRISEINFQDLGRSFLSKPEREKLHHDRFQREKEEGYQQLVELCRLGEYEFAKQLANQNTAWGYEIIDEVVIEKID